MKQPSPLLLVSLITAISVISLLSSDIYLPAFPGIAADFDQGALQVQLTMSSYLLSLSVFQIFYGILSDRFGRKRMLMIGLTLYIFATLMCAFAPNLYFLIFARALQGMGACAGLVIGRAIVGDISGKKEAARILSVVYPFVGLSPAVAPIIGGWIAGFLGWRAIFLVLVTYVFVLFCLIKFWLPESKTKLNLKAMNPKDLLQTIKVMIVHPRFIGYTTSIIAAYAAYFAYLTEAPFLFEKMGGRGSLDGLMYTPIAVSYIGSTLFGRKLLKRYRLDQVVLTGCFTMVAGALILFLMTLGGAHHPASLFIPMAIVTAGNGLVLSYSMAGTMTLFKESAGTASGLVGTLQLGGASMAATIMGIMHNGTALPVSLFVLGASFLGLFVFWFAVAQPETRAEAVSA